MISRDLGAQFLKGFGGLGCVLRYAVDFNTLDDEAMADVAPSSDDDGADFDWDY